MKGRDYLQKQRQTYWVRMVVPADVQAIIGKKVLKVTTGHRDYRDARAVAIPLAREWQQQIEAARRGGGAPALSQFDNRGGQRSNDAVHRLRRSAALAVIRPGILLPDEPPDWAKAVLSAEEVATGQILSSQSMSPIVAVPCAASTPLATYADEWERQLKLAPKGRRGYRRLLDRFVAEVPTTLETLSGGAVQRWVNSKLDGDNPLDAKTLNKWLGALRSKPKGQPYYHIGNIARPD